MAAIHASASVRPPTTFVNLDFMRSVAVVLVAGSHLMLYLGRKSATGWAGITGVCIFFVHTSLVLMWSLERDPDVARFYLRRAFRIYPLWIVVLTLTLLTQLPMSPIYAPAFRFYHAPPHEIAANYLLALGGTLPANIVGASWSLPIEVDMYVLLPCLFVFARSLQRLWPLLLLDLFVIYHDIFHHGGYDSSLPICVPYFLPGIMAFFLFRQHRRFSLPAWLFPLWFSALVLLTCAFGTFRRSWLFCLVLGLSLPFFKDMSSRPVRLVSEYVARYSYGIYLSHIIAIGVSVYLLRFHALPVRVGSFILLFVGLPVLFYHTVEHPMIQLGSRLARHVGHPKLSQVRPDLQLEMAP